MIYIHGLVFAFLCCIPAAVNSKGDNDSIFSIIVCLFLLILGLMVICATGVYAGVSWLELYSEWVKS